MNLCALGTDHPSQSEAPLKQAVQVCMTFLPKTEQVVNRCLLKKLQAQAISGPSRTPRRP